MAGGGGSQPTNTTSTSVVEPPEEIRPYISDYMGRASQLAQGPYQSFGNRVSPLDPAQMVGMDMALSTAGQGQYVGNNILGELGTTASGGYLNANPYLDDMYNRAAQAVTDQYKYATAPQMASQAIRSNAFGDNAGVQQAAQMSRFGLGENLGNLATDIYGGNYQAERNRQMQAAQMFPSVYQGAVAPSQTVMGTGDVYRDYNQALLNQSYEDFEKQRLHQYSMLDVLGNAIGVGYGRGGTTTTTQPNFYQPNPYANVLGLGMLGLGGAGLAREFL